MLMRFAISAVVALLASLATVQVMAAQRMVSVAPPDGEAMLVKKFSIQAGTTVLGAEFENNDARTVFPEVTVFRGEVAAELAEAVSVASFGSVEEAEPGRVEVLCATPIEAMRDEIYYVAVRIPAGDTKRGLGDGAGIGAEDAPVPTGSFIGSGAEGSLLPISVDLKIQLVTGVSKALPQSAPAHNQQVQSRLIGGKPNPFNPQTTIGFVVAKEERVSIRIHDVNGRLVRTLVDERMPSGNHKRDWDGRNDRGERVAGGIYMIQLRVGREMFQKKAVLAK